ncbi:MULTISPECIES: TFIIB-type zinc ribbon-containing protein [unclassified Bartonella]|uniref:TFIIB-type zinc ribbon-containing protein n=1 Tax=unclassified Bartonella TaxID=2645622 RepID=UPI0015F7E3B0|nr:MULTISPECIES: zf-TFIIB domain-containing protein [unclassified Bartonella]UXM95778.1 zf-TFIIB domain-containing protein [Bartonella sp. HY329]UXN03825.1 zf-TFIIB domain-containing protein [Bartonella sp. HY406]UXN06799.1 zf-TFIIB domain-containing protein [Bartonella sp. HY761]UXN10103.1 zf-TFIIB domain-containing protein [Bartonella sp. HY328]
MQCPIDGETLVMSERSGIEIDYCPKCRGIWLDRGELDKILERGSQEMNQRDVSDRRADTSYEPPRAASSHHDSYRDERARDDRHGDRRYSEKDRYNEKDRYDDRYHDGKKNRKKSFLSEIFEFGD